MQPDVAHDLNDADEQILEHLRGGRNLPQNLAERLGYSRQYVQNRLQMLKAADYVRRFGGGLYELTDDGRKELGVATQDTDNLADLRTERNQLQAALDDCREQLAAADEVDTAAVSSALDDIEAAAERGDGQAIQTALSRARDALEDSDDE
jgi:DNA-binding Lrp family transcriptional regulator